MARLSLIFAATLLAVNLSLGGASELPISLFESPSNPAAQTPIDRMVLLKLHQLNIQPAHLCSDAVFVRRVFLDVIGTLPTAQEARAFIQDRNPNKRTVLIDQLLQRDEFSDYWANKWSDILRVKAEFPVNLWPNAAQAYHRWIKTSIRENKPYDKFVRELLVSNGSNFREGEVNFYRATQSKEPTAIARSVAVNFMGTRAEKWPEDRLARMGVFFSQISYKSTAEWKEEIVFYDPAKFSEQKAAAMFPDGTAARLTPERDPREVFADWLVSSQNPWFAKAIVNRVWSWLLGRGIIQEPDDIREDNPPSNPVLLTYLERELVAKNYDLKNIFRLILNSQTYQMASLRRTEDARAEANFARYPLRRLDAEILIDSLCQITGTTDTYSSAIPEPFTFIPEGQRAIALPDGSITSPFLELFGRPSRDTGLEAERNNRITANQRLHLLNSSHIQKKLEQSQRLQRLLQSKKDPREITAELYLTILSRFPTDQELQAVQAYSRSSDVKPREAWLDLAWALINSDEFLYRH